MAPQKALLTSSPANAPAPVSAKPPVGKKLAAPGASSTPFWVGLAISIAWVIAVLAIIAKAGPSHSLAGVPLVDWAIGVSAAVSPVAMVWMITAYLQRATDIQSIADPLRRQLTLITGESGAADARIRRFNQAIREQIELLRNAQTLSQDDLESIMDRVHQHRAELERFENSSTQQVKEIQDVVRRSMFQIEQMMDDKFTMMRVLDGKLQENGDGVARQVESVGGQVARMLEGIENTSSQIADALERAQRDSQRLADTSRLQESSLTNAAEAASETLGGLSSKIDLSVTRFLERASTAREEAERLAHALDAQTRALDEFSTTLPIRVSEAESVLRGVADRLYASEQLAREQALHLSDKLSQQVDGLQGFMDRFTGRLLELDSGLGNRQSDLNSLADRIGVTTTGFLSSWEKSVTDLNDRTGNSLLRFTVVNDETRRNAEAVAAHLSETTDKYEDVVTRMRALSSDSSVQMKGMTEEIARHLSQFESLSAASNKAGEEVQQRANIALQNLQHVLERVLAAREATQLVGETLVKDINDAVTQNEKMIQRLNETAQLGARAISTATETVGRQQGELVSKARVSEAILVESAQKLQQQSEAVSKGLREQSASLMNLLSETQGQLISTDQKLQIFASTAIAPVQAAMQQIDASADLGLRTLGHFGEGLTAQVGRLQDFHTRIGGMSQEMGKTTSESAAVFETLSERFSAVRASQEEAARQTLAQFSEFSDRLQREVSGLDGQAARAAEVLQEAALKVGEQSYQMLEKAQSSGAQIKNVAASLQAEAAQIQTILRQQSEEIDGDLTRAEQKFTSLGETIRERADAAYALLDRATAQYGAASQNLDHVVSTSQARVENLHSALVRQADQIGSEAAKIGTHTEEIAASSGRAVQNLSVLNDKLSLTHDSAVTYSDKALGKLDETATSFQRHTVALTEAAQTATEAVIKAGVLFGEQTGKLVDGGHQIDSVLRQLTQATSALSDQASAIRIGMEQQNSRLLSQLAESVEQLDLTGNKLQQVVAIASEGSEQASARFADMTDTAAKQISATAQDLNREAARAETTLAALGANITQQAASLSVVGEQMGEQQRLLAEANEKQRVQMTELFDKLGAAHAQAGEVAQRSISYLSDSLQDIHRQLGMVGDQSQTAVGNVKMASMGFSEEAALLLQNAQAAEQQARTVLSVTASLQEQARQLRESLTAESERAGESLGALLGRLTSSGTEVRELGVSTNTVFSALQQTLGEQTGVLNSSMEQISDRQRTLTSSLDQQRETINALLERLTLAQNETAAAADLAAARLTDGTQQIVRHIDVLDTRTQSALSSVQTASAGFAYEAEAIVKQATQAEIQAQAILASAAGMHQQIDTLRASMREDGEQTTTVLGTLLDKVTSGAAEIRDLSATTEMSLASLGGNVTQQSVALTSSMQQIDERQKSLAVSLDGQRDVVTGLLNRLTLAQDETAAVAEQTAARLSESAEQVARQAESIDARAQGALVSVQAAAQSFVKEAEAIDTQARQVETQAQAILASTSGMQEQIGAFRTTMCEDGEKTTAVLGALLDKVTSGAAEIRDLSATTEISLLTLGNNVTQQSAALTASMQQISERQKALAASLDEQREVVNGLLNRLTLAQDETVDVAERAASRLTDSADQVARQAGHIDARTQSALVSVQAAAELFAKEVEGIDAQAKQVEAQAQAILASTSGMHGQISELRSSMQNDGERATAVLDGLLNRVTSGSGEVREASASAEQVLTGLQRALGEQTGELSSSMQQIGERQRTLTEALEQQRETINAMLNRFALAQDETAAVADRTVARLNEGAQQIAGQIDLIGAQAHSTLASVKDSVSGFAEQTALLNHQSQLAEQQVRGVLSVTAGMQEQAQHLREAMQVETARVVEQLSSVIGQLDLTSRQLKSESGEAVQALDQTAQRFASTTEIGVEMIRTQSEALTQSAEQSEQRINSAGEKLRGHLRLVGEVGDKSETQARQLADTAEFATTRLVSLRDTLDVSEKHGRDVVATATQRIDEVKAALQIQMQHLAQSSQQAVDQVAGASQTLASQSEALRANLAASESALGEAAEMVREEAKQLPSTLNRSVTDIEAATRTLKGQAAEADQSLISTADRFISVTSAARNNMIEEMQHVSSVADEAGKLLGGFNQLLVEQVAMMQQGAAMLSGEQKDLVEKASAGVSSLSEASNRLISLRNEASVTAERLVHDFDLLDQRAAATGGRLAQAGEGIAKQVEAIAKATTKAESQISEVGNTLRDQLETIRSGLQGQVDDINRGLMQITAQLERTGASLRSTTVGAVADVERVGQRFEATSGEASAQLEARTQKMREATEDVAKLLAGFGGQFDTMLDHMARAGDDIKHQEGNVLSHLQTMLSHLGTVAEKLEVARMMSGDVSHHAIERLDEVVNAVQAQMNNMTAGAQTAAGIMRGIGQIYSDQTSVVSKGVGEAHSQVMSMNKNIDEMQQRTDRMRASLKMQSDELMNSLRQILMQLEMTGDGLSDAVNRTLQQQASSELMKIS